MNLAKYMKGCITMKELEELPNSYSHTIYKQYVEMLKSEEKSQAHAAEEMVEELTDT